MTTIESRFPEAAASEPLTETMMSIPYYFEVPANYYRIVAGYHLQSEREALNIAADHIERTGQSVIKVHRPRVFSTGMPYHLYARSSI